MERTFYNRLLVNKDKTANKSSNGKRNKAQNGKSWNVNSNSKANDTEVEKWISLVSEVVANGF